MRKLLVHPEARGRGIARALMLQVERHAVEAGRRLLTLEAVTGGAAERLYSSIGYVKVGVIPSYALRPDALALDAATIMYKELSLLALAER